MNGPESRCNLSLCSGMELHHPIMSKLWDIGGRTKKKGKKRKSVLRMIMMAASQDGERPACELPQGCKTFMNCTGTGMAESELTEQLNALGHRNVSFAHGKILALNGGVFLYSVGGSPTNLSAFCFAKGKPLMHSKNSIAIVLNLIHCKEKGNRSTN